MRCVVTALLLLLSLPAAAVGDVVIPDALKPWVPWALYDQGERACPTVGDNEHRCQWPGALDLAVTAKGGTFSQRFTVMKQEHVVLPGGDERWPQDVTVDGKKAVVIDDGEGHPTITLETGTHLVRGAFVWDEQPESLAIAAETPVVTLSVAGRAVLFPRRASTSISFDRDDTEEEREEDSADVAIFRKVVDDAPLLIETRLVIDVAGKAREITVPNALLPGFETALVSGPVPVRVEGTSLRAQARPGSHTIVVVGRSADPKIALKGPAASDDGPAEEIWVYEARPSLRVAHVDAVAIAADQTRLPTEWRTLPAYRVLPGEAFTLVEDRRGDADAPPSALSIYRTIWLDFDGNGATVRDLLSGSFTGDRLEMAEGTALGHVAVGGKDAFITSLAGGTRSGVEVRQRTLHVVAESRIPHSLSSFPAIGWAHDFQGASLDLQLPPGYGLWSASGVDDVSDTWVQRWTLFEIFLVVLLVIAVARLWGPALGLVAALAFVLTFQENDAPIASWCFVVVLAGLHRALPDSIQEHPAVRGLAYLRLFVAVIVALITLSFAVGQVRVGMYPSLAQPWRRVADGANGGSAGDAGIFGARGDAFTTTAMAMAEAPAAPPPPPPPPEPLQASKSLDQEAAKPADDDARGGRTDRRMKSLGSIETLIGGEEGGAYGDLSSTTPTKRKPKKAMTVIDPDAVVQTGPGLPRWGWSAVSLSFSGPVKADQTIQLWVITPMQNLVLAFLRVLLLTILVACAFGLPGGRWPRALLARFRGRGAVWLTGLVLATSSMLSTPAAAQTLPEPALLDALRDRLLAPPWCGGDCVQIPRLQIEASSSSLRLVFEVHADADFAVAVPADDDQWTPRAILVDGKPADAIRKDASLIVRVSKGVHAVLLEGPLPARDSVALTLPMVPKQGSFSSSTWLLDGIHEDGVVDGNLQLTRIEKSGAGTDSTTGELPPSVLPPFLLVERTVMIGLTFEVETRVVRLSPPGASIVVDVPLLAGESVTTDGVRAEQKDGKGVAKISLGPGESETSWRSTLAQQTTLTLTAPSNVPWLESWQIQESPLWHVTRDGIPTVHGSAAAEGTASFRPWPGETITLQLVRPAGVAGQTVTIDEVKLMVSPGLRSTDAVLTLELRASRGGQHTITLPAGTELLSSLVNGQPAPLRPSNDKVTVPLSPGSQRIELHLRLADGVVFRTDTPVIDVGGDAVNVELGLDLPQDRWILFVWGPRSGPAVLFWSFLLVIVGSAVCLSRVPVSPLKLHQWVLLSLGLTQVPVPVAALVAGWLLVLGWRRRDRWTTPGQVPDIVFAGFQVLIVGWTLVAVIGLGASIHEGLAGSPEMQIAGNGSSGTSLRWFADRTTSLLPLATAWSVPMMAYRAAMLAWSFWLAASLLGWIRMGFRAFGTGGYWRELVKPVPPRMPMTSTTPATVTTIVVPEAPAGAPTSAAAMSSPSSSPSLSSSSSPEPAEKPDVT